MMFGVSIQGDFRQIFADLQGTVESSVRIALPAQARRIKGRLKRGTPVDTGLLKKSWTEIVSDEGVSFENPVYYAGYVETGAGWPSEGPRTKEVGGTVFSRQAIGGIIAPVMEDEKWLDATMNLIVKEIARNIEKL